MSLGRVEEDFRAGDGGWVRAGFIAGLWMGGCPRRCGFSCPCEASHWKWGSLEWGLWYREMNYMLYL
jgi:hypothetical protein